MRKQAKRRENGIKNYKKRKIFNINNPNENFSGVLKDSPLKQVNNFKRTPIKKLFFDETHNAIKFQKKPLVIPKPRKKKEIIDNQLEKRFLPLLIMLSSMLPTKEYRIKEQTKSRKIMI